MATPTPIDIATPTRLPSSSPSQIPGRKLSTLTSALQNASPETARTTTAMNIVNTNGHNPYGSSGPMGQRESFGGGMSASSMNWTGTRPISMDRPGKDKPRRESMAGSLMGGMSWGGVSVGSWIRDDVIMAGSSPFGFQSPSFHSSSYLPKMEANFMKDFACCGLNLPSLHDLLQHYEECHADQGSAHPMKMSGTDGQNHAAPVAPDNKAALAAVTAAAVKQQADQQRLQQSSKQGTSNGITGTSNGSSSAVSGIQLMRQQQNQQSQPQQPNQQNEQHQQQQQQQQQPLQTQAVDHSSPASQTKTITQPSHDTHDMDEVEDMEMDDVEETYDEPTPPTMQLPQPSQIQQASAAQFGRPNHRTHDPLGLNTSGLGNQMQTHQGLRNSQPPTPAAGIPHGMPYQHNPTVSSVNTPSLGNHHNQHSQHMAQNRLSPDSSMPGTPSEMGHEYAYDMNHQMANSHFQPQPAQGFGNYGMMNEMPEMFIDDPAKRLLSPGDPYPTAQQIAQFRMNGNAQGYNQELLNRLAEQQQAQQMMGNMGNNQAGMLQEEPKPFRCPVIGCEKAYKNQNGLKYHKQHGHQTQQLFDNQDGTFSIVNPETSTPYPGTLGMEKEKPYRCDYCGKRYKNLNGLKYHKAHSPPCSPEARNNAAAAAQDGSGNQAANAMNDLSLGVNPNGLGGIGEEPVA